MNGDLKRPISEQFKEHLRKSDPYFDEIEAALDQFGTGGPVSVVCSANGERIVVERSYRLGRVRVRAGDKLLREISFTPRANSEGPLWVSSKDYPPSDVS